MKTVRPLAALTMALCLFEGPVLAQQRQAGPTESVPSTTKAKPKGTKKPKTKKRPAKKETAEPKGGPEEEASPEKDEGAPREPAATTPAPGVDATSSESAPSQVAIDAASETPAMPNEAPSDLPPEPAPIETTDGLGLLSGRLWAYARVPIDDPVDSPLQQLSTSLWVSAHPKFGDFASAKVTFAADLLRERTTEGARFRGQLREAYVQALAPGWDVRLGQQIIPWGNADAINPTDVHVAKDLTFFAVDPEVQRIGSVSLRVAFTPNGGNSPFEFTLVATPSPSNSVPLEPPGLLPSGVADLGILRPSLKITNGEAGMRASYNGDGWDVAVMAFRGYLRIPEYYLTFNDAGALAVARRLKRFTAVGMEASVSAGKWVFRWEGAFTAPINSGTPGAIPTRVDGVLGAEWGVSERFRVNLQGIVRRNLDRNVDYVIDADPTRNALRLGLFQLNGLLQGYDVDFRPAATARLAYTSENDTFEAEVFALSYFDDPLASKLNYILRPLLTYRPYDPFKVRAGAEYYGGPKSSPLGALRDFGGAFFDVTYSF